MRASLIILFLLPSSAYAACPALPERSETQDVLMEQVRDAETEAKAQELNNQLWRIWTTAPDSIAQELLDSGMSRRSSYDFVGALDDFNKLVEYCPDYAEGYNQRAFVHFLREDFPSALADLSRALEITPDHIGAASGLALTLLEMGREEEGQAALRFALSLNPWLPERFRLTPDDSKTGSDTEL